MAMGGADTENRGVGKPEGKRGKKTNETKGIDGKMFWESIDGMGFTCRQRLIIFLVKAS
jgi:hypothetical protein